MFYEPPEGWRATLEAISGGPRYRKRRDAPPEAVVPAEGLDEAALAGLVGAGIVVTWAGPDGRAMATLTPWGAHRLRLEIGEYWRLRKGEGWVESGMWQPLGTNDRLAADHVPFLPPPDGRGWSERKHLSLTNPAVVKELAKRAVEVLRDEYTGEPIELFGQAAPRGKWSHGLRLGQKAGRTCTQ